LCNRKHQKVAREDKWTAFFKTCASPFIRAKQAGSQADAVAVSLQTNRHVPTAHKHAVDLALKEDFRKRKVFKANRGKEVEGDRSFR